MKNLKDYILEVEQSSASDPKDVTTTTTTVAPEEETPETMDFEFNFKELIELEKTIEGLQKIATEHNIAITVNNNKVSFTANKEAIDELDAVVEYLQTYITAAENSGKRNSSDAFGVSLTKFTKEFNKLTDYIAACAE